MMSEIEIMVTFGKETQSEASRMQVMFFLGYAHFVKIQ